MDSASLPPAAIRLLDGSARAPATVTVTLPSAVMEPPVLSRLGTFSVIGAVEPACVASSPLFVTRVSDVTSSAPPETISASAPLLSLAACMLSAPLAPMRPDPFVAAGLALVKWPATVICAAPLPSESICPAVLSRLVALTLRGPACPAVPAWTRP